MLKSEKVIIDTYWYLCQSKLPNNQSVIRRDLFDKMMLSIIRIMRDKDKMIESLKKSNSDNFEIQEIEPDTVAISEAKRGCTHCGLIYGK